MSGPRTSIGTSTSDSITVRGYDLCGELMGRVSFGDMLFLLVAERLPTPAESTLLNAILVALADHGLTPSALAARLTYTGAPESLQGAIASGLLGAGDTFLGALEGAAKLLQEGLARAGSADEAALRRVAAELAVELLERKETIPGLGHPIHRAGDPRTDRLLALAEQHGLLGPRARLLRLLAEEVNRHRGQPLPINFAGAAGAVLADLGFHWSIVRGFAVVSRAAGLLAHIQEEQRQPLGRFLWELAEREVPYVGPRHGERVEESA